MTVHNHSATRPAALKANIRALNHRIKQRQDSIACRLRSQMNSPAALIVAGFFGVAVHQSQQLNGSQLLEILQTANAGLLLLVTATSSTPVAPD